MACGKKVTEDVLYDCIDKPLKGISGSNAVLINYDDVDWSATVVSGSIVSDLVLKSGATGYKLEWYKDLASSNSAFTPNTEDIDGFANSFLGRLMTTTAEHAERANELKQGRFIVVYEGNYKGADSQDAFKVRGFDAGLRLAEMTDNTLENSGSILFTLTTEEGDNEEYPYRIFLETDYATSKSTYDALFATP